MEKKIIEMELVEENGLDLLKFSLSGESFDINLNSDDQSYLRKVFYAIIADSFLYELSFKLKNKEYKKQLFVEIAEDYINKLNTEIKNIVLKIPNELKKKAE